MLGAGRRTLLPGKPLMARFPFSRPRSTLHRAVERAPTYGCFTEGHDTLDLKQAKALLDELHAQ
jgi:predicted ATPase